MLSTVREGSPTPTARNETTNPDDHTGHQSGSGRPRHALTPFIHRYGTVPDDQQLSCYRPNGSQREREHRVRQSERAEIPRTDRPGDE